MARLRSLLTVLVAVAMTGTVLTGSASALAGPGLSQDSGTSSHTATFGIQPATAKGVDNRDSFAYEATGGAIKTDYVAITNYSTAPLQLHLYATDAYNTADGGFTVLPSTTKPRDIGLWVSFGENFLTVPAKTTDILPFILRVPENATPGDHTGGIMVSLTTIAAGAKGSQIAVESRVGARLAVRVPGALHAQLTVTNVSVDYHNTINPFGDGSATVSYIVNNTGNVRLAGTQAVRVTSLFGGSELSAPIAAVKELLPGNSMRVVTQVSGVLPSFTSTVRITVVPVAFPGDLDPAFSSVERTATMLTIPWPLIILLLLLAAGVFLLWRRRRRSGDPAEGGGPEKPKPTAPARSGGPARTPAKTGPRTTAPKPKVTAPAPKAGVKSVRP
jgi:hypothetical protein